MASTLTLDGFKLFQATFEIRYDEAFLLWDRAGVIWSTVSREWPHIKCNKAEPNNTTFTVDNCQLSATLDKAHIIDLKPTSSLSEFINKTSKFVSILNDQLSIKQFKRIGFRLIYVRKYPDEEAVAKALIEIQNLKTPNGKCFNINNKVLKPTISYHLEDDTSSVRIALEARETKVNVEPDPRVEELTPIHIVKNELIYDIDYSTIGVVSIGQLNVKEWINQIYHLIKRDSNHILGGN